ncbi:hypothetical protein HB364_24355 [Pseudoflavitalea sp. X16]|uniref:hypothetical protein n=1 Tax=Paraflavitalea devenefica TaxID=2716334 RepID=UPI001420DB33|nr:hypothetical protein [Paraflavitalea devenefica]NII28238.1 hypothetical protein [Paraflavitalea devenefica]
MKILPLIALFLISQLKAAASDIFYWNWCIVDEKLHVSGRLDNQQEITITLDAQTTIYRFTHLYVAIEEKNHSGLSQFLKTVDALSNELVKPFIGALRQSKAIVLTIDWRLLFSPIEVLMTDSMQLALYRPMLFQMGNKPADIEGDTIRISKGLILRDTTADTDNNCQQILSRYPQSELKYIHTLSEKDLASNYNIDFLFVSSHGQIDGATLSGGIKINDTTIVSENILRHNNPKLIYMDACALGLSVPYLYTLSQTKEINYYIGSLITVDISDAATYTINRFFYLLEKNHNPVISLWKTKQACFHNYGPEYVKSMLTTINKSLMFRVYKL